MEKIEKYDKYIKIGLWVFASYLFFTSSIFKDKTIIKKTLKQASNAFKTSLMQNLEAKTIGDIFNDLKG